MAAGLRDLHLTAKWAKPPLVRLMCCICLNEAALRDTFTASGPLHLMLLCNLFSQQKEDGQQFLFFFFFNSAKSFLINYFHSWKQSNQFTMFISISVKQKKFYSQIFEVPVGFLVALFLIQFAQKEFKWNIVLTAPFTSEMYTWVENIVSL